MNKMISALEAADKLQIGRVSVLRPHLHNPASEGGVGLEIVTEMTVNQLVERYSAALIALTHFAQFMVVYGPPDERPLSKEPIVLDEHRSGSDMIWHTDEVHRKNGSVNIITGSSSIPTGLATKQLIHSYAARLFTAEGPLLNHKKLQDHLFTLRQTKMLHHDAGTKYLFELWSKTFMCKGVPLQDVRQAFWNDICAINADPNILWIDRPPVHLSGKTPSIFTSKMHYHCKGYTPTHEQGRDGDKRRHELIPSVELRTGIYIRTGHLDEDDSCENIDVQWFDSMITPPASIHPNVLR